MNEEKYYFLKLTKTSHWIIKGDEVTKTTTSALYEYPGSSRMYRQPYPVPNEKGFRLLKRKRLSTILKYREKLHEYCGDWYEVYDQDGNEVKI